MASADQAELVFVVDVSSLDRRGFVGSTMYRGKAIDLGFDDEDEGVFLTSEMALRLHVKKGSKVLLVAENERKLVMDSVVSGVGRRARVSNSKLYYEVGKEGGAVVRIRKA